MNTKGGNEDGLRKAKEFVQITHEESERVLQSQHRSEFLRRVYAEGDPSWPSRTWFQSPSSPHRKEIKLSSKFNLLCDLLVTYYYSCFFVWNLTHKPYLWNSPSLRLIDPRGFCKIILHRKTFHENNNNNLQSSIFTVVKIILGPRQSRTAYKINQSVQKVSQIFRGITLKKKKKENNNLQMSWLLNLPLQTQKINIKKLVYRLYTCLSIQDCLIW